MRVDLFDFDLDKELIAKEPANPRDASRGTRPAFWIYRKKVLPLTGISMICRIFCIPVMFWFLMIQR